MFKFVEADVGSFGPKKKHVPRACETCRKRKKRCYHNSNAEGQELQSQASATEEPHETNRVNEQQSIPVAVGTVLNSPILNRRLNGGDAPRIETIQHDREHSTGANAPGHEALGSRFIGDLNPEAIFQAATSPDTRRGSSLEDSIGVWLARRLGNGGQGSGTAAADSQSPSSLFYGSEPMVKEVLVPVLVEETLSTLPPRAKIDALSKIYFERIHPIFPVIDEDGFNEMQTADPGRILLQQGICLAASKNYVAREHLLLSGSDSFLSYRKFGNRIFAAMRLSIELGLVADRIVLIQALVLMSHFADGPDGGDLSAQLCGRAVHYVQTIGLHLRWRLRNPEDTYGITLLCCVWALDRMNAAFFGRPVLMHERDIGTNLEQCFEQRGPYFRLFLHVILLLDKIIELYRPLPESEPRSEIHFPSFEDLVAKCPGSHIATPLLATIETLYHGVAILSYRSRNYEDLQRSSTSYLRQNVSNLYIGSTISREYKNPELVLFPFVPYTISLALSIAYREMRHNKIAMHRARARAQFQANCDALDELGGMFWSAANMAEMGKATLKEMDRVFSAVAAPDQRRNLQDSIYESMSIDNTCNSISRVPMSKTANESNAVPISEPQNTQIPMQGYDLSLFDPILDIDLFGMFDPAFDLQSIDALLEGNLDLSFPNH